MILVLLLPWTALKVTCKLFSYTNNYLQVSDYICLLGLP